MTPLHLAAANNPNVEITKFLVSQGANLKAGNNWRKTPWDDAVKFCYKAEVVEYLISQGCDVKARGGNGMTPLHVAAQANSNVGIVESLIFQYWE
jgi:ankyrin repeat protein